MIGSVLRWKELERWVPFHNGQDVSFEHPLVPLEDLLSPRTEKLVFKKDLDEWSPITIHFDGSIVHRNRKEPFKGGMFAAYPGDLIFSKIDARNGALGIIPQALSKVVVTSEYPVHVPDGDIVDPEYISLILRTKEFLRVIQSTTSGTSGRKRITPENFRAISIPLPDREVQTTLIKQYASKLEQAANLQEEAKRLLRRGEKEFEAALGLTPPPDLPKRLFQIARFNKLERWSHEGILQRELLNNNGPDTDFPIVTLGDVIADLENGWSPQCENRPAHENEWGVLKLGAVSFGIYDEKHNKALPKKLKPKQEYEVRPGDLLISRANITRLVGACVLVENTRPHLMLCDKIFRVVLREDSSISPFFLNEVLKTSSVRQQIESKVTGTSPTMKNISKPSLLELSFPLPSPVELQDSIASALRETREKSSRLQAQAAKLRKTAWEEFNGSIFS
jgi:type I restriction enzyme, S subunit